MKAISLGLLMMVATVIAVGSVERSAAQSDGNSNEILAAPAADPLAQPQVVVIERAEQQEDLARHQAELAKHMAEMDAQMAKQAAKFAAQRVKFRTARFFANRENTELDAKIDEAAEQVRDAQDEAAKAAATQQLVALLDKYFEEDMASRKEELQAIQARLDRLRAQLDRRRAKKPEIIDLQLKVALNEADGLGFYSQPRDENLLFNFRVPVPMEVPVELGDFDVSRPAKRASRSADAAPVAPRQLQMGDTGELVYRLQRALNSQINPSPNISVDGDFGPETQTAVKAFQVQHGLKETGVVDAATRKALELPEPDRIEAAPTPVSPVAPPPPPVAQ